jgi:Ni/Co efflux regulator RcnB
VQGQQAQPPAVAERRHGERRDQGQRDADRTPRPWQSQAQPQQHGQRGDHDRRYGDRRDDHRDERRNYGYVVPRPYYSVPPPVYYTVPGPFYGGVPQPYYPYAAPAPLVFQPGDFLPPEYRSQQFVVQDWEWRGLSAPPYGYQWMLLGPDTYALVLFSTGQIVSVVAAR